MTSLIEQQIADLTPLVSLLTQAPTIFDKIALLDCLPCVQEYVEAQGPVQTFLAGLNPECEFAIKAVIAIGQAPVIFNMRHAQADQFERLRQLLNHLLEVESFYQEMGGIVGYHLTLLQMIRQKMHAEQNGELKGIKYLHPEGLSIDQNTAEVRQSVRWGVESLVKLAEIYPVGGAGDRLNLIDSENKTPLPAAILPFLGRTLIEGLIRDLQAREYLYFKLYGQQLTTPVAMMTSMEKNNHFYIIDIFQSHGWFGRLPSDFYFFMQPLVPVITVEGNWSLSDYLTLNLKPGGHGVIWKLAEEKGMFNWLDRKGRQKAIIRQINNPVAGTDLSLLALAGIGCKENKAFGSISCERLLNSAEGTNVLIEKQEKTGFTYCITNIEYTEFAHSGVGETPAKPGSPYSIYPTNTNILFADLHSVRQALKECAFPGQIINLKNKFSYLDPSGHLSYVEGGRLETTMQNIADCLKDTFPKSLTPLELKDQLRTFIIYNQRIKTISTTKKSYHPGESPIGTPEQAYHDLMANHLNLLRTYCKFTTPELNDLESYLEKGPACIFLFHPALGPLYSIIGQKIRGGRLSFGSELQLEIAEVDISDLSVEGSLLVESTSPLGCKDPSGILHYGKESRCRLHRAKIKNKGIDRNRANCFWKNEIKEREACRIILNEGAEFEAQDITFEGDLVFEVPSHHCLTLTQNSEGKLVKHLRRIERPSWHWEYKFDQDNRIQLIQKNN